MIRFLLLYSEDFRQTNCAVSLWIDLSTMEQSPHDQFCRRNRRPSASKCFFNKQLSLDLGWVQRPYAGLLLCFGLIRTNPWFVTCDDLINLSSGIAIIFFQHLFIPIDMNLFLSVCEIVRDSTRANLFRARCSCNIECMLLGEMPNDSLISRYVTWRALSVHARHQCSLVQRPS